MLYRIQRFGIKQTSKLAGIVYFLLGIMLIPFFYLAILAPPPPGAPPRSQNMSPGLLLLLPFFYGVVGYVMTALILYIYNRVAMKAGGVELDIVYAVEPAAAAEHGAPITPVP
ncbi:MAG: hypothetical protein H0W63_00770 [Gemmatimonadaceae bacterium]|nr:hypothetical protein [Gemmatimonadaceae bacterium]